MFDGGVDAAVIHPPPWDPDSHQLAVAAVRNYPGRFAIMGSLPLDGLESKSKIATWRDTAGVLGLRYLFLGEAARARLRDASLDWLWAEAERAGVPIAVLATDSLREMGAIAERHPGLRLVMAPAARPGLALARSEQAAHMRIVRFQRARLLGERGNREIGALDA